MLANIWFSLEDFSDNIPYVPGVYILKNEATGHVYVGASKNLRNRFTHWQGMLGKSKDWKFVLVRQTADWKEAHRLEARVIYNLRKMVAPKLMLNCLPRGKAVPRSQPVIIQHFRGGHYPDGRTFKDVVGP